MTNWEEKKFGGLYLIPSRNGLTRPSSVRGAGYKFINMGEIFSYNRIGNIETELVQLNEKEKKEMTLQKNDLLFARQSLVFSGAGKCSIMLDVEDVVSFESHLIRVRLNPEIANPIFFYYYFSLPYNSVKTIVQQCAQAGIRGSDLEKIKVHCPHIETQNQIADILSTYDDLIEANNRRIELLEQAAQELYREWFVRFRFPGYETTRFVNGYPSEWERKRLGNMIVFNPTIVAKGSKNYKSIPMAALSTNNMVIDEMLVTSTDILSGSRSQNLDTLLARITPCLENGKTGFVFGLQENEVAGGSTEFIVMRSRTLTPYYVYFLARSNTFREYAINSMNGADGRQRVKVDRLEKIWWLQPPKELLAQFDLRVKDSFELIHALTYQNQILAAQRDALLPRLMSGKLEV